MKQKRYTEAQILGFLKEPESGIVGVATFSCAWAWAWHAPFATASESRATRRPEEE